MSDSEIREHRPDITDTMIAIRRVVEVIRHVHAGKKHVPAQVAAHLAEHFSDESLTPREIDVLQHVAGGNRNRDIGERLFISEETVKVHFQARHEQAGGK